MPIKILMPALSPTMTEGNIAKWLKKEGDKISPGEVIAEIETDKATMEVEAVDEGILARLIMPAGAEGVAVNSLIAVLIQEDEKDANVEAFIASFNQSDKLKVKSPAVSSDIQTQELKNESALLSPSATSSVNIPKTDRIFASPLAKRIAAIEGISLSNIHGSGPKGRIVKSDVLSARQNKEMPRRQAQEYFLLPNSNMRKIIAKRLLESKLTIPHFYLSIECMMDSVFDVRSQINGNLEDNKIKLSVNDFIILACAKALKEVPAANASWTDNAIIMYNNVDVAVAVAVEGGLITPIIKNADQKDIFKVSMKMKELAKKAKENTLSPEEFQGGSFTISNLGMYGIKNFKAIINPPQSCIMAVGTSSKRPVVVDNNIEVKTIMDVTLSCDHRVVDGVVGAKLLASFKKYIEAPALMFVS